MSTNKVNLSLDEIISKRKQNITPNNSSNPRPFLNNRRNFGERRRYEKKDLKTFPDKNFRDDRNLNVRSKPHSNKFEREENSSKNEENSIKIEQSVEDIKGTRLFVSNLQRDVVNSELRKIFSTVGPLKKCGIHWDELGFSKGTGDIEYVTPEDAQKALMFDTAEIEGVQMKVEFQKPVRKEINLNFTKKKNHDFKNFKIKRERNIETIFNKNRVRLELKKKDHTEKN